MLPVMLLPLTLWEAQAQEEILHKFSIGNSSWIQPLRHSIPDFSYMCEEASSPPLLLCLSHCSHLSHAYWNSRSCGWRQASLPMLSPNSWPRECISLLHWRFYTKKLRVECPCSTRKQNRIWYRQAECSLNAWDREHVTLSWGLSSRQKHGGPGRSYSSGLEGKQRMCNWKLEEKVSLLCSGRTCRKTVTLAKWKIVNILFCIKWNKIKWVHKMDSWIWLRQFSGSVGGAAWLLAVHNKRREDRVGKGATWFSSSH